MSNNEKRKVNVLRRLRFFVINAFITNNRLTSGNPAAVVLVPPGEENPTDDEKQALATQMNLSETAFVNWEDPSSLTDLEIQWFTPTTEVDLCGHATLAAAVALSSVVSLTPITELKTKNAGVLKVQTLSGGRIAMEFPIDRASDVIENKQLLSALGLKYGRVRRAKYDYVVELESQALVAQVEPDFDKLREVDTRGVAVCSKGAARDVAFVARFFAPKFGINEDPVTGSMMCILAPLFLKDGAPAQVAKQLSKRGGLLQVAVRGEKVEMCGASSVIVDGEVFL